jgi:hypothetical protein
MKTYLLYGCGISIASALVTLVLYSLGYHNDPEKFQTGQNVASTFGYLILIVGLFFGMRAVRNASETRSMSYGRGVGTGTLIALFSGIVSAVFVYIYGSSINPDYHDLILEIQTQNLEEAGLPQAQHDQALRLLNFFTGPGAAALLVLFMAPLLGVIFSLIVAIFVKRAPPPTISPPAVPAA